MKYKHYKKTVNAINSQKELERLLFEAESDEEITDRQYYNLKISNY